ncbi:MAG: ArnT family glycosyltransferase [Chthoniobacterales bacterium]
MPVRVSPHFGLTDRRSLWLLAAAGLALCLLANLPWQVDDYDQAKQAFTSFQMVNRGRWLYQETPHDRIATKPPLVGWFSAISYLAIRNWELAWRIPSVLAAAGIAYLLFRAANTAFGTVAAVIALAAFIFNLITPRLATLVRTDMPLALVVFAIGLVIWDRIRTQTPWRPNDRVIIFALLSVGMLIKGPVVLAFLLPGLIAFRLWLRRPIVSAFPGFWPWIASLAIFLLWVAGGVETVTGFYDEVVVREFFGRFGGDVHRSQPMLFYLPHLLHKFAPWSLLLILFGLLEWGRTGWNIRSLQISAATRWLILWSLGGLLIMSLVPSKRVDRIFPVIPPLCLLLGAQTAELLSRPDPHRLFRRWAMPIVLAAVVFSGGYVAWKVNAGYRHNRAALADFGRAVRQQVATHSWRYAVVSSPDESLLLYLQLNEFLLPQQAIEEWNAGKIDAIVVSNRDAAEVMSGFQPAGRISLKSGHRQDDDTLDYLLVTKPD